MTVKMNDRAFRKWKEFALRKKELSYFPANPMHVAVYLQYVLESTRSSASVYTAFYSIKWAHESAGLVSPTDNPLVNRMRDAAKRILGTKRGKRKEPLSVEILKDVIDGSDLSNTLQLRNVCLYVLCYAGFFRSGEVTSIRRSHIKFLEDHMIIKVEKSKTDQLRQGDEVVIARSGGSACPVSILQQYLSRLNIDPHSDELFSGSWSRPSRLIRWLAKTSQLVILLLEIIYQKVCVVLYRTGAGPARGAPGKTLRNRRSFDDLSRHTLLLVGAFSQINCSKSSSS